MEDMQIIALYHQRDESAIVETEKKYGKFCKSIAHNILANAEDAKECVNDTYLRVWNAIPPQQPTCFRAWIGRIVRNIALHRWEHNNAQKRSRNMETMLSELEECLPSANNIAQAEDAAAIRECLNRWLASCERDDRILFVRRYWNGIPLKDLAEEQEISAARLAQKMYRLRNDLRKALEQEGITL